jgi:hypothetical protein
MAGDPAYKDILERMRKENYLWMSEIKDVGLIPETESLKGFARYNAYDALMAEYLLKKWEIKLL